MYLEKLTHRLTDLMLETPCNDIFIPKYKTIDDKWIAIKNGAMLTLAPGEHPPIQPHWNSYEKIPTRDYSQGGVYTRQQLINMQKAITFGRYQTAIAHKMTMQYRPGDNKNGPLSPTALFPNSDDWLEITSGGIFGTFWGLFTWWASVLTYATTCYFTFKFVTWLIGICYSVKLLQPLYGFCNSIFWSLVPTVFMAAQHREIYAGDNNEAVLRAQRLRQRDRDMQNHQPQAPPMQMYPNP